ncbi:hypothetical protein VTO73DRAFT_5978 [Trametes versicolor]
MQAGPMNVTIIYLSPIEVYSEIAGGWLSCDYDSTIQWMEYSTGGKLNTVIHNVQLQSPQKYVEINQQAQDGEAYIAMAFRPGLTWQLGRGDGACRGLFHDTGALNDSLSMAFREIRDDVAVFAITVDLGQIQSILIPVTWAVDLMPYYTTRYPEVNMSQAIKDFISSFPDIQRKAIALDNAIAGDALKISPRYADLVSLAARQTLGSLDITVSTGTDGKPNSSNVRIFMKDVGSSTLTGWVNPVEKIYAALPMLLYLNASLMGPLLSPLLDAQDASMEELYAAQDIGLAYPNATGTRGGHNKETGNMLIMIYAHARFSGDGTLIHRHYDLAKRWTNYLVNHTLNLSDQSSADTEIQNPANMTNLALKGIIGVKAMAEISQALGQKNYAASLAASWVSLAMSSSGDRLLGSYDDEQSWALMYNLYADRLLQTGVVEQTVSTQCA